jgi:hypothetical protein
VPPPFAAIDVLPVLVVKANGDVSNRGTDGGGEKVLNSDTGWKDEVDGAVEGAVPL